MAYAKIGYHGGSYLVHRGVLEQPYESDHNARSSFPMTTNNRRTTVRTISATMAETITEVDKQRGGGGGRRNRGRRTETVKVTREKLDNWMKESVTEIVKRLNEAPLLVHLYEEEETSVVVMKAEEWGEVKGRWERGEAEMPEGIIFVERLETAETTEEESCGCGGGEGTTTCDWGLVVQGKGVECGPVCYLLKTTRVGSGMGMVCTHFCLRKVSSFRETSESQFRNCWLVGN